jgi:hypothetical protein
MSWVALPIENFSKDLALLADDDEGVRQHLLLSFASGRSGAKS